jgi:hypothetical protein
MIISGCDDFRSWGKSEPKDMAKEAPLKINPAQKWNRNQITVPVKDRAITIDVPKIDTPREELAHGIAQINMANSGRLLYQNEYGKEVAKDKMPVISNKVYNKNQIQPVNPGIKIRAPIILTEEERLKGGRDIVKSQLEQALKGSLDTDGYIKICDTMVKIVKDAAEKLWWEKALAKLNRHKTRALIFERQGRDTSTPFMDGQIENLKSEIDERLLSSNMLGLIDPLIAPVAVVAAPVAVAPGAPMLDPNSPPLGAPVGPAGGVVPPAGGVVPPAGVVPPPHPPEVIPDAPVGGPDAPDAGEVKTPDEAEAFVPVVPVVEDANMPDPTTVDAPSAEDIARERAESVLLRRGVEMGLIPQADVSAVSGVAVIEEEKHDIPLTETTVVTGSNIPSGAPMLIPPPPPPPSGAPSGLLAEIAGFSSSSTLKSVPTAEKPALTGIAAGIAEGLKGLKSTTVEKKPEKKKEMTELEKAMAKRRGTMTEEPDDDEEEQEKLEELKEKQEEAKREAEVELEKQNKILEELINKNLVLIRKLYQAGRTPQLIDVVKIEAADMAKAKEQRLALQKIPKATVKWVKVARDKKTNDIDKVKRLIANAKKDGKSTLAMELQGDLDRFLNTTREFTPEGLPIVGTGSTYSGSQNPAGTKIKKKTKPVFDDTIDYVATALDLWMRCRNASKANPKKGPCGRMGKGKLKRMTQKEAMMAVEKLEKKLVKLS